MRQRKAKDLQERILACGEFLVEKPSPEAWKEAFAHRYDSKLFVEIGCGKGQFIIRKALANPENNYIAIEGQETVILRALEKAAAVSGKEVKNDKIEGLIKGMSGDLPNVKFSCAFVTEMKELFFENQLDGMYLNFSDPWPKARHYKRRLTYRERLVDYAWAIKSGGFIEIKTDNDGLFEFTLEEIEACEEKGILKTLELTRDLHSGDYESANTMTEYEEKFKSSGKNINYVKVKVI